MNLDECGKRTATYAAAAADLAVGDVVLAALDVVLADVCYQILYYYQSACCISPCVHQYLLKEHSVDSWDILSCCRPLILIPRHWKEVHLYLMRMMPLSVVVDVKNCEIHHYLEALMTYRCVLRSRLTS